MPPERSIEVRIRPEAWAQEVERLGKNSPARLAAERERDRLQATGVPRDQLSLCAPEGADGTKLNGRLKAYVPISDAPASQRPFGFVFSVGVDSGRPFLELIAFGERHPGPRTRSVYERAHKRLHGRYPDQTRSRPVSQVRSPSRGLRQTRGLER
ncbi:MAG: hypothetical protein J2O48_02455 [Solirubrobacterales bacterium]|nr:hypothetical protein [Solirubrobacterales bacterium]